MIKKMKMSIMGVRSIVSYSNSIEEIEDDAFYKSTRLKPIEKFSLEVFDDIIKKESEDHSFVVFSGPNTLKYSGIGYNKELMKSMIEEFDYFFYHKTKHKSITFFSYCHVNFYNIQNITGAEYSLMALHPQDNVRNFSNEIARIKLERGW